MSKAAFKDRLKIALEVNHMKAVELCEKTGIPKSAVSYYLSGKSAPRQDRIYLISSSWILTFYYFSA